MLRWYLRCRIHRPARIVNNQITQRIELAAITLDVIELQGAFCEREPCGLGVES